MEQVLVACLNDLLKTETLEATETDLHSGLENQICHLLAGNMTCLQTEAEIQV